MLDCLFVVLQVVQRLAQREVQDHQREIGQPAPLVQALLALNQRAIRPSVSFRDIARL